MNLNEAALDHYASLDPASEERPNFEAAVDYAVESDRMIEALRKYLNGTIGLDVFGSIASSLVEQEEEQLDRE